MKLVIDRIGTPNNYSRTIVNLDNITMLTLWDTGENEELHITSADGSLITYKTIDHQFGLPDGHGGIACASTQDVMNAYLGMDMEKEMAKDDSMRQMSEGQPS